ncbi:hypothetical protein MHYP_G00239020 [Metynnis hypsauchen]
MLAVKLVFCLDVSQEIQESMPGFGRRESWEDLGSGEENSGECDDEDGCQGSGEDTPKISPTHAQWCHGA